MELLEETEKTTESEEQQESPSEIVVGAEGTSPTKTTGQDDGYDDQTVVRNEKEEEPLSVERGVNEKDIYTDS